MYLAYKGVVPEKKWFHNPEKKDIWGHTTEYYLKLNNIHITIEQKEKSDYYKFIN